WGARHWRRWRRRTRRRTECGDTPPGGIVPFANFTCQPRCALKDRTKENQSFGALDVGAKSTENGLFLTSVTMPAGPFFCDDRRVLSVQPRQPFPVPWLGPLSSPRPWRPADAAEGGPSVMLRFDLPDGRVVLAEIAARLYVMTGRMIGARYPIED